MVRLSFRDCEFAFSPVLKTHAGRWVEALGSKDPRLKPGVIDGATKAEQRLCVTIIYFFTILKFLKSRALILSLSILPDASRENINSASCWVA